MNPAKQIIPQTILFILGVLTLVWCLNFISKNKCIADVEESYFQVVMALGTAAVSIVLPGFVEINNSKLMSDTTWPKIKAGGALAVFVVVYLFDPVNGG